MNDEIGGRLRPPGGSNREAAPQQKSVRQQTTSARPAAMPTQASNMPLRIEMAASGWCWVASQTDGDRVLYRLVQPGERVVLEGQRVISLRLGDAGSVTLSINDGARRLPGRDGEVVELEVTPDNVEGLRGGPVETVSGD